PAFAPEVSNRPTRPLECAGMVTSNQRVNVCPSRLKFHRMLQFIASSDWLSTSASRIPFSETTQFKSLTGPSESEGGFRAKTSACSETVNAMIARACRVFTLVGVEGAPEVPCT